MSEIIQSNKQFVEYASELLDSEAQEAFKTIVSVQMKYQHRANTVENLDELRDECLTRLAQIGILATIDASPVFYGEPPIVEIIGKVSGDPIHKQGFDHEQKKFEIVKAGTRGETFLGEKESVKVKRPKK